MRNVLLIILILLGLHYPENGIAQLVHAEITDFLSNINNSGLNDNQYVYHIWLQNTHVSCRSTTGRPGHWHPIGGGKISSAINLNNGTITPPESFNINLEAWEHDCNDFCTPNKCDQGHLKPEDRGVNFKNTAPSDAYIDRWHVAEPDWWAGNYNLRVRYKWYAPALTMRLIQSIDNTTTFCGPNSITLESSDVIWNGQYQWEYNDGSGFRMIARTTLPNCPFNIPEYNDRVRTITFRVVPYINGVACYPDENAVISHKRTIQVRPRKPVLSSYTVTPPKCFGQGGAEVNLNIDGKLRQGVDHYRYSLTYYGQSLPVANPVITSNAYTLKESVLSPGGKLRAGQYTIIIQNADANGSPYCSNTYPFTIGQPPPLVINAKAMKAGTSNYNISCKDADDGRIEVSAYGGTPLFHFAINGELEDTTQSVYGSNAKHIFSGLKPGFPNRISVIDTKGCSASSTIAALTEPPALESLVAYNSYAGNHNIQCAGLSDTSFVVVNGGVSPYNLSIDGNSKTIPSANGLTFFENLYGGHPYSVEITDANNCKLLKEVSLSEPSSITLSQFDITKCNGEGNGVISVAVEGGLPSSGNYSYLLSKEDTTLSEIVAESYRFENLGSGMYTLTAKDVYGCIKDTSFLVPLSAIAPELNDTVICKGQYLSLEIEDPEYSYAWTSGNGFTSSEGNISVNKPGTYDLTVTNSYGCTADASFELSVSDNVFTANFAMPSKAYAGDTIVISEVSWPIPTILEWTMPDSFDVYKTEEALYYIKLPSAGEYEVKLNAYRGECRDDLVKYITVYEASEDTSALPKFGYKGIKAINLYPNPNAGNFTLAIELTDEMPVDIDIYDVFKADSILSKKETGKSRYETEFNLQLSPGTYNVSIRTNSDKQSFKFVVQ